MVHCGRQLVILPLIPAAAPNMSNMQMSNRLYLVNSHSRDIRNPLTIEKRAFAVQFMPAEVGATLRIVWVKRWLNEDRRE